MILLKKRFLLFGILIIVVGVIYGLEIKEGESNEVVALPVNGKAIVVDAGHGGEDRWSNILKWSF